MRSFTVVGFSVCASVALLAGCGGAPTAGIGGFPPHAGAASLHRAAPISRVRPAMHRLSSVVRPPWMRLVPALGNGRAYVSQFTETIVNAYAPSNKKNAPPVCQIANQAYVNGLGVDAAQNLWVPSGNVHGTGTTTEFAPDCGKALFSIPDTDGQPAAIAFDRKHNVYVLNIFGPTGQGGIDVYGPGKKAPKTMLVDNAAFEWFDEAFSSAGDLYVVYNDVYNKGHVIVFARGRNPAVALPISLGFPGGLTFDAAGNLLVVDQDAAAVAVYAPPFTDEPVATFQLKADSIPCRFRSAKLLYCSDPTANSIDVYRYDAANPSGTSYLYSFDNGIARGSENAGIALAPAPRW